MKKTKSIFGAVIAGLIVAALCVPSGHMVAENKLISDSTVMVIKLKTLNTRKAEIEKLIKTEDGKRDRTVAGVTAETSERINIAQDSICLELRSELVSVNLEIGEIEKKKTSDKILK